MSGEDLALPVKRKVIAVLGDQDMGEKPGTGEALGDGTLGGGRLVDGAAGPATIARPADPDDPKPRRHMVQHFADRLADHMKGAPATGAGLVFEIETYVLARQMPRQTWPIGPRAGPRRRCALRRKLGFGPCDISLQIFEAELQLIIIKPFSSTAELTALQLLHDEPEAFDLRLRLREGRAVDRERANHLL